MVKISNGPVTQAAIKPKTPPPAAGETATTPAGTQINTSPATSPGGAT